MKSKLTLLGIIIWSSTGLANFLVVSTSNFYNLVIHEYNNPICKNPITPLDHAANFIWRLLFSTTGSILCSGVKGLIFGIAGPIGTYRMGLAIYNRNISGDKKWTDVILKFRCYQDINYITKPFGNVSWLGINKE